MVTTLEQPTADNLREWREQQYPDPRIVAEHMREALGETSRHFTSVTKMEKEGSYKAPTIRAYAKAVGLDFETALAIFEDLAVRHSLKKKSKQ